MNYLAGLKMVVNSRLLFMINDLMNSFVAFFLKVRNSNIFSGIVIAVIVASAIYAGVSSYDISPEYTVYLDLFDYAITLFFLIEIIIRMISERSLIKFFSDGWNIFDFLIVTISLVPINNVESVFVARLLKNHSSSSNHYRGACFPSYYRFIG